MSTDPLAVARLCADYSTRIAALEAELAAERKRREVALRVVQEQALDDGLWFRAENVTEDYLQVALRRLHAAIEVGEER